jgi:hypothetical protein
MIIYRNSVHSGIQGGMKNSRAILKDWSAATAARTALPESVLLDQLTTQPGSGAEFLEKKPIKVV